MKIVRRIFPYRDAKCIPGAGRPCFNRQIGLCPGVCTGEISEENYAQTVKNIKLFFSGKSKFLIKELKKQMAAAADLHEFERASQIKYQIEALRHVNDIALIKRERIEEAGKATYRIEAYDISHISGTSIVGVMTVVEDGEVQKNDYRKFNIRGQRGADDTKALREILRRRLRHNEWPYPDLIVVDGGKNQLNAARLELFDAKIKIPVVGVVKDLKHKPKDIIGPSELAKKHEKSILLANSESHRFAINFFRKKSGIMRR
jgi:excinuclease ABC subunit C